MSDNHPNGFLRHTRDPIGYRRPSERAHDYQEIYAPQWQEAQLREQGERCMDCGVSACTSGCPIGNRIPEWNDLVYRGRWREALARLHATNNFPEFTGYTCPAPCEPACTLTVNDEPVTIKSIERAIVDKGWAEGWIVPESPASRSAHKVAVVGSGPAGLAAAQQLNRAGHHVTVFERDDTIGGLMVYGIPDFKFAKHRVARRVEQLEQEGVVFKSGVEVGIEPTLAQLSADFDAVCLAIGAQQQRDLTPPGRELDGVLLGMSYLVDENRRQATRSAGKYLDARDKRVLVLGGGDTGADCVATAHRQGARKVTQISIRQPPPEQRAADNPWPQIPQVRSRSYALDEGGEEEFSLDTIAFVDEDGDGNVDALIAERVDWRFDDAGRRVAKIVRDDDIHIPAELVLIAVGFVGPQMEPLSESGLELTTRGAISTDGHMRTSLPNVFATGDAVRGQSLVVWAIGEGRDVAREIDQFLTGSTQLPASLRTASTPLGFA